MWCNNSNIMINNFKDEEREEKMYHSLPTLQHLNTINGI